MKREKREAYYFELFLKIVSYASTVVILAGAAGYAVYWLMMKR
ncbi:hypothetical protein [Cohnella caldifontis]|nr:hypothetical protein [Cohnella sp. YIM B05605]